MLCSNYVTLQRVYIANVLNIALLQQFMCRNERIREELAQSPYIVQGRTETLRVTDLSSTLSIFLPCYTTAYYDCAKVLLFVRRDALLFYQMLLMWLFRSVSDDDGDGLRRQRLPPAVQGLLGGRRSKHEPSRVLLGIRGGRLRPGLCFRRLPRMARRPQGTRRHMRPSAAATSTAAESLEAASDICSLTEKARVRR